MRTYLILGLVAASCFCVLAAGEALRRSDARLLTAREGAVLSRVAAEADQDRLRASHEVVLERQASEVRGLEALLREARREAAAASEAVESLEGKLHASEERSESALRAQHRLTAELLAANDRLEKAYKDIAEKEKQLSDLGAELGERNGGRIPNIAPDPPKIDGVVLGVSDKINLILISVGGKDKVEVGYRFTVYRGSDYVSKLVVDKVEDGWSACRELKDFRKEEIQKDDSVSTRVFD